MKDEDELVSPSSCMYLAGRNYESQVYFPALKTNAVALLDSGANHNIMSPRIAALFTKQRFTLPSPIRLTTADGSEHKTGLIREGISTLCKIGSHISRQTFLIASIGHHDVFLGFPWFYSQNPQIDW